MFTTLVVHLPLAVSRVPLVDVALVVFPPLAEPAAPLDRRRPFASTGPVSPGGGSLGAGV